MKTVSIDVFGKVQGVYFRKHAQQAAQRLNITGFVQNERDGSVHIVATGRASDLTDYIEWCKKGDPPAVVDHVAVNNLAERSFDQFSIQYPDRSED